MGRPTPLTIAYAADSDDAAYYDALENGLVSLHGYRLRFRREPMAVLNREALTGTNEVTAVSSVVYPSVADRYAILSAGAGVGRGRGCGPVLVSRRPHRLSDLSGRRVGVTGVATIGWFLLRTLCPGAVVVEAPADDVVGAVAAGDLDAGVVTHEDLLGRPRTDLRRVIDLGAEWCWRNALPLPVRLNVIRRDLGGAGMRTVCGAIAASWRHARLNLGPALARVSQVGRGGTGGCTEEYAQAFANDDSQCLPADGRAALRVLFGQMAALGAVRMTFAIDVVEPADAAATFEHVGDTSTEQ